MKKVFLAIGVMAFFSLALALAQQTPQEDFDPNGGGGGIPINDGNVWVCKGVKCQKGGIFPINKQCAYIGSGATNASCEIYGAGKCP